MQWFDSHSQGDRNLPVILFLHGFMGDAHEFDRAIAQLSDRFHCLTVDLPGHGLAETCEDERSYTMPATAKALINLLDHLKIEKCFLVGYSMGGRLALYLTLYFPERFLKIVLESASPGLKTQTERELRSLSDRQLARELETGDLQAFLAHWYSQTLFSSLTKHPDFNKMLAQRLKHNPLELAKSLRNLSIGQQPALWEELKHNKLPLLLLTGSEDLKFEAINHEMTILSQSIQHQIIKGCGHNIHLEDVEAFAIAVKNFFHDPHPHKIS
jgi:2-succinyl-6-hydroxy-2,4-cyclohexadiene-1-carboxylate synthase